MADIVVELIFARPHLACAFLPWHALKGVPYQEASEAHEQRRRHGRCDVGAIVQRDAFRTNHRARIHAHADLLQPLLRCGARDERHLDTPAEMIDASGLDERLPLMNLP